jgi:hypothetical protein
MVKQNPKIFDEITLISPSFRGLFGCDQTEESKKKKNTNSNNNSNSSSGGIRSGSSSEDNNINSGSSNNCNSRPGADSFVEVTMEKCAEDVRAVMKHAKIDKFHTALGWSLGSLTVHVCCAKYPGKLVTSEWITESLIE